jgi:hypothetical protein
MEYVGILLDDNVYRGIPYGKTGYENIAFYEETARMHGLVPCYFRLKDINPGMKEITTYVRDHSVSL